MNHSQQQFQKPQYQRGFQMPAEPANISSKAPSPSVNTRGKHPMLQLSPAMMTSIKKSPKGKLPPGLEKYLAEKKAKGGK